MERRVLPPLSGGNCLTLPRDDQDIIPLNRAGVVRKGEAAVKRT